jgi:hypothetical protein
MPVVSGHVTFVAKSDASFRRNSLLGDQFSLRHFANQFIDEHGRRNQHRSLAEPRHLRWNLNDLWLLRLLEFFAPARAAAEFAFHLVAFPPASLIAVTTLLEIFRFVE